ncbi:bifunctional DNA primase/polymerase [Phaeobacter sp. J2-8]|uniref:bifunctional DNA primase/polymerase n=1 Tax=Phaeobacter sp. J2-8 TaxID=2931394 RepID=UPI001FD61F1D|nr:bifunctional DNA primase/polymerase [Phaeobacter sp. J2-8]MCJ7871455.1 bifunctional DNA primase/polymerase [Phaeobacter sp. J2-8]
MAEYSSNADLSQSQSETDLSDLFEGFLPVQAANALEPNDLFERTQQPMPNVDVALSLAARGLAICPVRQWGNDDGWKPIARFPELATSDPAQIRKWWRDWPEARVALITGERNGISVLDVDVKNGKDGLLSLSTLGFDDHRTMTPIRTVTPSGGLHLFFAYKPDLKATVGKIGPGLDVRNNCGFVIAPGSLKDGKLYRVEGEELAKGIPLPNWPEALTPPRQPDRQLVDIQEATNFHREWALDYLTKLAAGVAATAEGGRQAALNDASLWAGGAGAHGALSRDNAAALLIEAGKTCGLSEREARDTFNHGWNDGLRKPIELPPDYGSMDDLFDDLPENFADFPMSEDGVALAFAAHNADRLRFCHTSSRWYVWTGSHWKKEESKLAFDRVRKMCRARAASEPRSAAAKALAKAATASAVERFAQADRAFAVTADLWDPDHWLLGTPGGTVDLRTGEVRPARQSDMITKITAATPLPLEFSISNVTAQDGWLSWTKRPAAMRVRSGSCNNGQAIA